MYKSLLKVCSDFRLYVLPMDDKCREILNDYKFSNIIVLNFEQFISKYKLRRIYTSRNFGVFCWTCTPYLIDFVLTQYKEPVTTYVDADLYFYCNPQCLLDEMRNKTVQIVPHRYNPSLYGKLVEKRSGTYCVQFNTFKNTKDALELLHWWCEQCYSYCSSNYDGVFGDQGYLENWEKKDNVSVLRHLGGGVAPWNLAQYKYADLNYSNLLNNQGNCKIFLVDKYNLERFPLVFFHYQGIRYLSDNCVNINVYEPWKVDIKLVNYLYKDYLKKIANVKFELKSKFGLYYVINDHPAIEKHYTKKKNLFNYFCSLFSLLYPKNFYFKIIFRILNHVFGHLNIIYLK